MSDDMAEMAKTGGGVGGALLALAMVLQRAFKRPAVKDTATTEALKSMASAIGDLSEKISVLIERLANQAESHDDLKDTVREQAERIHALELKFERMEALMGAK